MDPRSRRNDELAGAAAFVFFGQSAARLISIKVGFQETESSRAIEGVGGRAPGGDRAHIRSKMQHQTRPQPVFPWRSPRQTLRCADSLRQSKRSSSPPSHNRPSPIIFIMINLDQRYLS